VGAILRSFLGADLLTLIPKQLELRSEGMGRDSYFLNSFPANQQEKGRESPSVNPMRIHLPSTFIFHSVEFCLFCLFSGGSGISNATICSISGFNASY
jgi:hypothetical protein